MVRARRTLGESPRRIDEDRDVEDAIIEQAAGARGLVMQWLNRVPGVGVPEEKQHRDAWRRRADGFRDDEASA
jgi:hypothetical protein